MKSIDYYNGVDLEFPIRPSKPGSFDRNDPQNMRDFADRMEAYQERDVEYRADMVAYRAEVRGRRDDLMEDLGRNFDLTSAQTQVVFTKAWEDGHSSGITEVINLFGDFVDLIESFNNAVEGE
jgi:hypothetical protein